MRAAARHVPGPTAERSPAESTIRSCRPPTPPQRRSTTAVPRPKTSGSTGSLASGRPRRVYCATHDDRHAASSTTCRGQGLDLGGWVGADLKASVISPRPCGPSVSWGMVSACLVEWMALTSVCFRFRAVRMEAPTPPVILETMVHFSSDNLRVYQRQLGRSSTDWAQLG
jgi:hypothetical protein